jgi:hypothetical protein
MGGAASAVKDTVGGAVKAVGDVVGGGVKAAGDVIGGGVNAVKDNWVDIRDTAETAAVIYGNTLVPGSSMLTSKLVSEGSQKQLNSDAGKLAQLGSSAYGASNLGSTGSPTDAPVSDAGTSAATSAPVAEGSVVESTITTAPTNAATTASASSASSSSTLLEAGGPGQAPVFEANAATVPAGTSQTVGASYMGSTEALAYGTGAAVLAKKGSDALEKAMTPEYVPGDAPAATPERLIDATAGERRATASEISNVMAFQSEAAQRKRASGAAVLSNTAPGSNAVGAKKLTGA